MKNKKSEGGVANWRESFKRENGNRCLDCGVKQGAVGYYDLSKTFVECDSFMIRWAEERLIPVVRINLFICEILGKVSESEDSKAVLLCQKCQVKRLAYYSRLKKETKGIIYPKK